MRLTRRPVRHPEKIFGVALLVLAAVAIAALSRQWSPFEDESRQAVPLAPAAGTGADFVEQPARDVSGPGFRLVTEDANYDLQRAFVAIDETSKANPTVHLVAPDIGGSVLSLSPGQAPFAALNKVGHQLLVSDRDPTTNGYRVLVFDLNTSTLAATIPASPDRIGKIFFGNALAVSPDGSRLFYVARRDAPVPAPTECSGETRDSEACDDFAVHVIDVGAQAEVSTVKLPLNCGFVKFYWFTSDALSVACPELGSFVEIDSLLRPTDIPAGFLDATPSSQAEPVAYRRMADGDIDLIYSDGTLVRPNGTGTRTALVDIGNLKVNGVVTLETFLAFSYGEPKSSEINGYFTYATDGSVVQRSVAPGTFSMLSLGRGAIGFLSHSGAGVTLTVVDPVSDSASEIALGGISDVTDVAN